MAKKIETTSEKLEREYIIPLRKEWKKVPRYKRANKATKAIKEFLVRHMKIRDRDLKKIKIDKYLNQAIWFKGIKKPPIKIKVKAIKQGDSINAELAEIPQKLKFKKLREEKQEKKAIEFAKPKKEIVKEEKPLEEKIQEGEEKAEEKEKIKAGEEAMKQLEKESAKKIKHQIGGKTKEPKRQRRMALAK